VGGKGRGNAEGHGRRRGGKTREGRDTHDETRGGDFGRDKPAELAAERRGVHRCKVKSGERAGAVCQCLRQTVPSPALRVDPISADSPQQPANGQQP
jgi:hypothetical protein